MLDRILQTIGHNLQNLDVDFQRVKPNGTDWTGGYVNFFKIGQLGIIQIKDLRKADKPNNYEKVVPTPTGFEPESDEFATKIQYSPSNGNMRSCSVVMATSGYVMLGNFDSAPTYGVDGTLVYKIKVGGVTDVTIIVLPNEKGVILC